MKNLFFLAVWALILSFLLGWFYWSDAPLVERLMFGGLTTLVTGTWLVLLLNMPRALSAVRAWFKSNKTHSGSRPHLGPNTH